MTVKLIILAVILAFASPAMAQSGGSGGSGGGGSGPGSGGGSGPGGDANVWNCYHGQTWRNFPDPCLLNPNTPVLTRDGPTLTYYYYDINGDLIGASGGPAEPRHGNDAGTIN